MAASEADYNVVIERRRAFIAAAKGRSGPLTPDIEGQRVAVGIRLRACSCQPHVVFGLAKSWRVMGLEPLTPFTVYEKVPLLPSLKESDAIPTAVVVTCDGFQFALNAGPVVR